MYGEKPRKEKAYIMALLLLLLLMVVRYVFSNLSNIYIVMYLFFYFMVFIPMIISEECIIRVYKFFWKHTIYMSICQ